MSSHPPVRLRPLRGDDVPAVRALVMDEINRSPYGRGPLAAIEGALAGNPEYRGIAAIDADQLVGIVVFGATAGAEGAGRLYLVAIEHAARTRGIATVLVEAAIRALATDGSRFITVEIPDDPALSASMTLLGRCGFREEGRVADYFREGIALVILRRGIRRSRESQQPAL